MVNLNVTFLSFKHTQRLVHFLGSPFILNHPTSPSNKKKKTSKTINPFFQQDHETKKDP